jgi:RHS repeat-associated protein
MHIDSNKGKKIDYNFLNLPERVYPEGPGTDKIRFIYDASGVKWQKKVTGSNVTTTTYNGSFIYNGNVGNMSLDYALNSEGMIKAAGSPQFHYFLKDHLGNTRAVIYDADADGQLDLTSSELLQQTDYYPFGMPFEPAPFGADNKYLYNGKEMQEDAIGGVGLDWYDYGARFYDPALGRFHTPDPIAPFIPGITPYNYAFNNPVNLVDLEGLIGDDHDPKKRDRRHRRYTRRKNVKNKIYNLFNIPHDAMANRAKTKSSSNKPNSSSTTPSGGSLSNDYKINFKESPNDNPISSFPFDAVKPLEIESIIPQLPSTANSIRWNDRFIDLAGQIELQ